MNDEQALLAGAAITTFRLNGQFLALADELAKPAGLTASWWQVLGAVLVDPLPVSGIARDMGITRQSVQRVADILVADGVCEYRDNPAHRRAKLVAPTEAGRQAVARIGPGHRRSAAALAQAMGHDELVAAVDSLRRLSAALAQVNNDRPEALSVP